MRLLINRPIDFPGVYRELVRLLAYLEKLTDGGSVTQATNKSTAVTLNAKSGRITMNGAALAAGATVSFVLTNSEVGANDVISRNYSGGTAAAYLIEPRVTAAASVTFDVTNRTAGNLSEAIVIRFAVQRVS